MPSLRVVLVSPKESGNVGSVARAMKNFGLHDLVLVAPRCALDRTAYALASHAGDVLDAATVVGDVEEAVADRSLVAGTSARPRAAEGLDTLTAREAPARLAGLDTAVLFGPEESGLSNAHLDRCRFAIRIPTAAYASLNLAQAVNVVAYEWFQAHGTATGETRTATDPPATRAQLESMYVQLRDLMLLIGYTDPQREASILRRFRHLIDRADPSAREVAALRGLWSQTRWAADQPPDRLPGRRDDGDGA